MKALSITLIVALTLVGSPALAQGQGTLPTAQQTQGAGDLEHSKLQMAFNSLRREAGTFPDVGNFDEWRELAEAGFAPAQLVLGTAYEFGKGTERDREAARSWLIRAAESGNTTAPYNLGLLELAEENLREAFRWSYVAENRAGGQIQKEATLHANLFAMVNRPIHIDLEQRSGNDWIDEFPEDPSANLPADIEVAFVRIQVPQEILRAGWREIEQHMIPSVQANLASGQTLEIRSHVTY